MSKKGFRGYIASRPIRGETTPQQIQNLVIRDYVARQKIQFLLSATEYAMPGCYMMLESVLDELDTIEGLIVFSLFMLPQNRARRRQLLEQILSKGAVLHSALEGIVLRNKDDLALVEDLFMVDQHAQHR